MSIVPVDSFSDLLNRRRNALVVAPAAAPLPAPVVDLVEEQRGLTYLKLVQIRQLWENVFQRVLLPAIWQDEDPDGTRPNETDLRAFIKVFDSAMMSFATVVSDQQATARRLEDLLEALQAARLSRPDAGPKTQRRQREQIRRHAARVLNGLATMERKIETPGWFMRLLPRSLRSARLQLSPELQERLGAMAGSSLRGISRDVGTQLRIRTEVIDAFAVLDLPTWSTQQEMHDRYKYLARRYHPDQETGSEEMFEKITSARNTLLAHYASDAQ